MMARKKKIHHRHNRLSFGGKLAFVLLTILSAVILIPIVFTFLYSFFPQSEITAYLKGRGSYDNTTKWLDVLVSARDVLAPAVRQDSSLKNRRI